MLIMAGGGGFFLWQQRQKTTPEYSLLLLQTAIQEHNWEKVKQRVDLESFNGEIFTQVVAPSLQYSPNPYLDQLMEKVRAGIRSKFIASLNTYLQAAVTKKNQAPDFPEQFFARNLLSTLDVQHFALKKIVKTTITGKTALVDIIIRDDYLAKDLSLTLTMEQLPDKTWQIKKPNNTQEFLTTLSLAQEKKLAVLNEPLSTQLAKHLVLEKGIFTVKTGSSPWRSTSLIYEAKVNFISSQAIKEFIGQIRIYDKNNKLLYEQKYIEQGNFLSHTTSSYRLRWPLDPAVPEEKIIINTNPKYLTFKETILKATFTDGTSLELLTTLPK